MLELLSDVNIITLASVAGVSAVALITALLLKKQAPPSAPPSPPPAKSASIPPPQEEVLAPSAVTAPAELGDVAEIQAVDSANWRQRLRRGLERSRVSLLGNLASIFSSGARFDEALLEKLHETLYRADIGVATTELLVQSLRQRYKVGSDAPAWDEVRTGLVAEITRLLDIPQAQVQFPSEGPLVILVVGVNGAGKTTSIGKLAAHFMAQEKSVMLAAGDTFRAAAIDQLQVWADRLGVQMIRHQPGSDPAAVAYDAVKAAMARKVDVLLIDTAGRLHSKKELMDELAKIKKVVGRDLPGAPHETWLVLDATTGQNGLLQARAFREVVAITGLIVTKLDGTAKGGVVIGATLENKLPIRYIGVGEKAADLRGFVAKDFAESLL